MVDTPTTVCLQNHEFEIFITEIEIFKKVQQLSIALNTRFKNETPLLLVVMNGAFMFAGDLLKNLSFNPETTFVQINSYDGMKSTGSYQVAKPIESELNGRSVVIIEDVVDSGGTIDFLFNYLKDKGVAKVIICSLLFKPGAYKGKQKIDYFGFEIADDFVIGYGLDFNGLGRNLKHIYKLNSKKSC